MSWLRDGDDRHLDHLGEDVAGLVDGHLQHQARERALAHLAHCAPCRAEVDGLRRMRSTLLDLGARTPVPYGLADRLLALPQDPLARGELPHARLSPPGPVGHPFLILGPQGPSLGQASTLVRRVRVPRAAAAGAALALGLGGVLAIGAPTNRPARPSFEPPTAQTVRLVDSSSGATSSRRQELVSVRPASFGSR